MAMGGSSTAVNRVLPFVKGVVAREVMVVPAPEKASLLKTLG